MPSRGIPTTPEPSWLADVRAAVEDWPPLTPSQVSAVARAFVPQDGGR